MCIRDSVTRFQRASTARTVTFTTDPGADVTGDGKVNLFDLVLVGCLLYTSRCV